MTIPPLTDSAPTEAPRLSDALLPQAAETISPLDITHQTFGRRTFGYDRGAVRTFLERVAGRVEALLHERQALRERLGSLERELEERRQSEDEIRRAVVAAERIGHDLRENAARQCELMLSQAQTECDALRQAAETRAAELEAAHGARVAELEVAYRDRMAELERQHHDLTLERDRAHAERTTYLDRAYSERHADLSARLSAVRTEYAQFVSQYRALMQSFSELSARHLPAADDSLPATTPVTVIHETATVDAEDSRPSEGNRPPLVEQNFA
ncbi:cell division initiation protein [Deinococcus sp. HSC-46F16]|uniref:DivIVA domain-containing protein n=1 Tax=Deinococcus sp. HSC-46F16 TaxID=2910968 RepID=UPI0020A1A710|nr:DivIVA domain-containing protein [Deinococcus sp. HSC-46F16]MCP2013283.1 cell division initiation protein [Deinococcus sp. HSC-46F16]